MLFPYFSHCFLVGTIELSLLFICIFEEYIVRHSLRLTKLEKILKGIS